MSIPLLWRKVGIVISASKEFKVMVIVGKTMRNYFLMVFSFNIHLFLCLIFKIRFSGYDQSVSYSFEKIFFLSNVPNIHHTIAIKPPNDTSINDKKIVYTLECYDMLLEKMKIFYFPINFVKRKSLFPFFCLFKYFLIIFFSKLLSFKDYPINFRAIYHPEIDQRDIGIVTIKKVFLPNFSYCK